MARRVTSHDVASRAGVSRTTVSLVLNKSEAVVLSTETRERVFQAAAELGYSPNSAARMLVRGDTETIGLIISDVAILPHDGFVPMLLQGVSQVNKEYGYHVLLEGLSTGDGANPYESLVKSRRIDGLIVLNPKDRDPHIEALIERKFPIVLAGSVRHPEEYSVNFTTRESTWEAVDHLVRLGHRHIGSVQFSSGDFVATENRLLHLRAGLARHGLSVPEDFIEYGDFSAMSGHFATRRLLERHPEITAIMAGNDTVAVGVISGAAALGRAVPRDLSVIGFDDLPVAAWLTPALTTIRVDAVEQGIGAARLLIRRLRNEPIHSPQILLPTQFVERDSCAPPAP
jgi:DNA-binding LacI/PurR family transcriptional regulator